MAIAQLTKKINVPLPARASGIFMSSSLLLDSFAPQRKVGQERNQLVKESGTKMKLIGAFLIALEHSGPEESEEHDYAACISALKGIKFTSKDICDFPKDAFSFGSSAGYEDGVVSTALGLFISSLVNTCDQKRFSIDLRGGPRLDYLGYMCCKQLTVHGNVGGCTGISLANGHLVVNGNAEDNTGIFMYGGKITINGNVGAGVGGYMCSGLITVNGKCFGTVGGDSIDNGSVIRINGNIVGQIYSNMGGGDVYQYGKRLVKDGVKIHPIENK